MLLMSAFLVVVWCLSGIGLLALTTLAANVISEIVLSDKGPKLCIRAITLESIRLVVLWTLWLYTMQFIPLGEVLVSGS